VNAVFEGLAPVLATLGCVGLVFLAFIGYGRYKQAHKDDT